MTNLYAYMHHIIVNIEVHTERGGGREREKEKAL